MSLQQPKTPSRAVLEAFITRHQQLLQLEREAEEEQTRLLNSNCSPKLLEQRGLALGSLGVSSLSVGLGGKSLLELARPLAYHTSTALPPHTFRNGDPVRIEAHVAATGKAKPKKDDEAAVEGVIYRVSAEKITVAVDGSKEIDLPERLRLLKLANSVTFDRMDRTLAHLRRIVLPEAEPVHPANLRLVEVLLGMQQPRFGAVPEISWYGDRLNDSQKDAIRFCLAAESLACIHGPPGTGKTHTLVELIFQLLSRPASETTTLPPRILVCTPSNLALDNLLLRLHALQLTAPYSALLPRDSILRLGHPTRVHRDLVRETLDYRAANGEQGELLKDVGNELQTNLADLGKKRGEKGAIKGKERGKRWDEVRELRKEYRQREAKVVTTVVGAARVVLATCHSAGSRQLNNTLFDVCIIDEATQAVEAVCWVPVLKAKKLILAGDPQQLPPTIMSRKSDFPAMSKLDLGPGSGLPETGPGTGTVTDTVTGTVTETSDGTATGTANRAATAIVAATATVAATGTGPGLRPPKTLETTLFDRLETLYGPGIKRVLQVQYRMNEHIAAFPSQALYESRLTSDPSVATHTLLDLPTIVDADEEDTRDTLAPTVVFYDTAGCEFFERTEGEGEAQLQKGLGEGSKSNENEADLVARYARKLVSLGVPAAEIAVVTPYQAQVSLVAGMLRDEFPEMTIGSVDGLQGQEREAIILTLVRSNPKGEVGFLGEHRRLNVAMTRAKRQLCVVGDSATVSKGSAYLKKWMEWLEAEADVRWAGEGLWCP